jgi:hypothetical protein
MTKCQEKMMKGDAETDEDVQQPQGDPEDQPRPPDRFSSEILHEKYHGKLVTGIYRYNNIYIRIIFFHILECDQIETFSIRISDQINFLDRRYPRIKGILGFT